MREQTVEIIYDVCNGGQLWQDCEPVLMLDANGDQRPLTRRDLDRFVTEPTSEDREFQDCETVTLEIRGKVAN